MVPCCRRLLSTSGAKARRRHDEGTTKAGGGILCVFPFYYIQDGRNKGPTFFLKSGTNRDVMTITITIGMHALSIRPRL